MPEKITKALKRMQTDTPPTNLQTSSNPIKSKAEPLGNPACPLCGGAGYLRYDVPVGHEKFGKIEACVCRAADFSEKARKRLYSMSSLDQLAHLRFENFRPAGNPKAKHAISAPERENLEHALEISRRFAQDLQGWLLLEGSYGSGKTHLAAAVANQCAARGVPTLFITVPDLLDSLRAAYNSPETSFEERFEDIRRADLLVMDDFGTQNATPWAQEKLFQILNHRYINQLPTVITTNLVLDEIESRIRSRLQDEELVQHIRILALDYRHPEESSNPGLSMLSMRDIKEMTLATWQTRESEIGQEIVTVTTVERKGAGGYNIKEKEITRETVTKEHIKRLHEAFYAASHFADTPQGWLALLGPSFCGKTHLAAAIGHYRKGMGGQAVMVDVSVLLDYLKQTFRPNADVSFDRRFYEIRTTPLLILDGLKESSMNSAWAEDKLHQILNYRYYEALPTVITSTLDPEAFAKSYPSLWNRMLDPNRCTIRVMDMPPYRAPKTKNVPKRKHKPE